MNNRWLDKLENPSFRVFTVIMLGLGVGYIIIHEWGKAVESIAIGFLMLLIYRLGRKIDGFMKDDEN
ncbi:hypothetical protein D3C80_1855200 [compost metagenome]